MTMLHYKSSAAMLDPTAVEEFVCERLAKSKYINSTDQQLDDLQFIMLNGHAVSEQCLTMLCKDERFPFLAEYLERVNTFPIKMDFKLTLWIVQHYHSSGIQGWLLIAYYLQWVAFKKKVKKLSLSRVINEVFKVAVISPDVLAQVWDEQKCKADPDNLIDYASAVLSFMPDYDINWKK